MTREAYHKALKEVQADLLEMSAMAATAIKRAMAALKDRDIPASEKVVDDDSHINRKRFRIEERCVMLIATQQPMAVDLRVLAAIINVITDLERIADHAEGIAKISIIIGDEPLVKPLVDMPRMGEKAGSSMTRG